MSTATRITIDAADLTEKRNRDHLARVLGILRDRQIGEHPDELDHYQHTLPGGAGYLQITVALWDHTWSLDRVGRVASRLFPDRLVSRGGLG